MRKWCSNTPDFLSSLPEDDCQHLSHSFDEQDTFVKILGLIYHPSMDSFKYNVIPLGRRCSKRNILSELAKIFDPLEILAPLTFFAKHLIQYLWTLGLEWDESPPDDVLQIWGKYKNELPLLSEINITRQLIPDNYSLVVLHGFADSSEKGYAALVYLRFQTSSTNIKVNLVYAKSKVAPIKKISLPRLELYAAVLLSDVLKFVLSQLQNTMSFYQRDGMD